MIKSIRHLISVLLAIARKRMYVSMAAAVLLLTLFGLTFFVFAGPNTHTAQPKVASATKDAAIKSNDQKVEAAQTQPETQPPAVVGSAPAAQNGTSQATLLVSPSVFTVKQGESLQVTMQASNGKAINMPGFTNSYGGKFLMNFAAGPAKKVWTGPILMLGYPDKYPAPGTYTLDVFAQDNAGAYYRSSITVNIVQPTMNISVQSLGYDQENDALLYTIKINRLHGFDEPVTEVAAVQSAGEPGFICLYVVVDADTLSMACGHDDSNPSKLTGSGTITIDVATDSIVRTAAVSYSVPLL